MLIADAPKCWSIPFDVQQRTEQRRADTELVRLERERHKADGTYYSIDGFQRRGGGKGSG